MFIVDIVGAVLLWNEIFKANALLSDIILMFPGIVNYDWLNCIECVSSGGTHKLYQLYSVYGIYYLYITTL